jgi:UDP-N-acetylmuramate dehydrogenase
MAEPTSLSHLTPMGMANLTTMGVGGVPEKLWSATTRAELIESALAMWAEADEWLILGGGSNLVFADEIPHLQVLQVATKGVESENQGHRVRLLVEAGELWDDLVAGTVAAGISGLEALSGIPGTVGASPIQNIGAYGAEVASSIAAVEFLDYNSGEVSWLKTEELGFAYRDSVFKRGRLGVVLRVEFSLTHNDGLSQPIAFEQLAGALGVQLGEQVPVSRVREEVLRLRASKGMVLDAGDRDTAGCGSFFTNPIVSARFARTLPTEAPKFETVEDDGETVKLSAAWLIEHAGVKKGFRLPGSNAAISSKHSLAITNRGGATALEVAQLAEYVQLRVANQFGINLVSEPVMVGFED